MADKVYTDLIARVFGLDDVAKLEKRLRHLNQEKQKTAMMNQMIRDRDKKLLDQTKLDIQQRNAQIRGATQYQQRLTNERLKLDLTNRALERRLQLQREEAMAAAQSGKMKLNANQQLGLEIMMQEQANQKKAEYNNRLRQNRREILASTMSIFGMTMSIWQVTNALSALAGENEAMREEMSKLQAIMMGATGPILLVHGIVQMMNMGITRLALAARVAVPAMMALGMAYMTLTAPSDKLRAIYSVMVGVTAAVTVAQLLLAKAGVNEITGVEIMNLLVEMQAIDKDLWDSKLIWCQNLVDNLVDVYKNRRREIPQKPIITENNPITTGKSTQSKVKGSKVNNKEKYIKRNYGEFNNVLLTDTEHEKLRNLLGEDGTKNYIEKLSAYIKSKGKHYKDHYATILNWIRRNKESGKTRNPRDLPEDYTDSPDYPD